MTKIFNSPYPILRIVFGRVR